jgi:cytoskeletal protein CcmA (bactofilin family)
MSDKGMAKELNLIGSGTIVEGNIRTKGNIRVDGKVRGEVHSTENLAIGASGEIEGAVVGKNVTIGGRVKGNVSSVEKLVLESKSVVQGDIRAQRLIIDEGAVFDGRVAMTDKAAVKTPGDPQWQPQQQRDQQALFAQQQALQKQQQR